MLRFRNTNEVAHAFSNFYTQGLNRIFKTKTISSHSASRPQWYDKECRQLRNIAMNAGKHTTTDIGRENINTACRIYRACKQRKKRAYFKENMDKLENTFYKKRHLMWKTLSTLSSTNTTRNLPSGDDFFHHFQRKSENKHHEHFDYDYEAKAIETFNRNENNE